MTGTRVIRETQNTDPVFLGEFIDFGHGYLRALPEDHRCPPAVTYALPTAEPVPSDFEYAIQELTHRFVRGHVRALGGPRCRADLAPQPTPEFVKLELGRLRPATIEEVAAHV